MRTFCEELEQVIALLQRHGRVTYRALKRQFDLNDDYVDDLKAELLEARQIAVDEQGNVLVWTGAPDTASPAAPAAVRMEQMAKPGSVLTTGETLRLAEGLVVRLK